jgi:hypothetical protein
MNDSFFTLVSKLPVMRTEPLSVRASCVLVIDNSAHPLDVRMLTLEQLQAIHATVQTFTATAQQQSNLSFMAAIADSRTATLFFVGAALCAMVI